MIADNVPIKDIPDEPYTVEYIEKDVEDTSGSINWAWIGAGIGAGIVLGLALGLWVAVKRRKPPYKKKQAA